MRARTKTEHHRPIFALALFASHHHWVCNDFSRAQFLCAPPRNIIGWWWWCVFISKEVVWQTLDINSNNKCYLPIKVHRVPLNHCEHNNISIGECTLCSLSLACPLSLFTLLVDIMEPFWFRLHKKFTRAIFPFARNPKSGAVNRTNYGWWWRFFDFFSSRSSPLNTATAYLPHRRNHCNRIKIAIQLNDNRQINILATSGTK